MRRVHENCAGVSWIFQLTASVYMSYDICRVDFRLSVDVGISIIVDIDIVVDVVVADTCDVGGDFLLLAVVYGYVIACFYFKDIGQSGVNYTFSLTG